MRWWKHLALCAALAGLHHEALDGTFRRRNARDSGLPALTIPAGFTEAGLPVGLELLGRALDDHRLVAFAFAYASAHPKRRAPLRTPSLVNGAAPPPLPIAIEVPIGGIDAALAVDLPTGTLSYRITIPDVQPGDVYGTVLRRTSDEEGAVVVLRLGGPEEADLNGAVALSPRLLNDLLDRNLELLVHTSRGLEHSRLVPSVPTVSVGDSPDGARIGEFPGYDTRTQCHVTHHTSDRGA